MLVTPTSIQIKVSLNGKTMLIFGLMPSTKKQLNFTTLISWLNS